MNEFEWLPGHVERGTEAKQHRPLVVVLKVAGILLAGAVIVAAALYLPELFG